jgi:hypothetical protein
MMDHLRKIVHRNARIEITTQVFVKPSGDDNGEDALPQSFTADHQSILAWRRCPTCRSNSKVLPIGSSVWHLSFAKFVDYLANGTNISTTAMSNGECQHCIFHEHHHYFSSRNYIACFKVIPIRPLHVVFSSIPAKLCAHTVDIRQLLDKRQQLVEQAESVFRDAFNFARHELLDNVSTVDLLISTIQRYKDNFNQLIANSPSAEEEIVSVSDTDEINSIELTERQMRSQHFLYHFVSQWNKRSQRAVAGANSSATLLHQETDDTAAGIPLENGEYSFANLKIELPRITSTFANEFHLELPLNYGEITKN